MPRSATIIKQAQLPLSNSILWLLTDFLRFFLPNIYERFSKYRLPYYFDTTSNNNTSINQDRAFRVLCLDLHNVVEIGEDENVDAYRFIGMHLQHLVIKINSKLSTLFVDPLTYIRYSLSKSHLYKFEFTIQSKEYDPNAGPKSIERIAKIYLLPLPLLLEIYTRYPESRSIVAIYSDFAFNLFGTIFLDSLDICLMVCLVSSILIDF